VTTSIPVKDEHQAFIDRAFKAVLGSEEKDPLRMYEKIIEELGPQWKGPGRLPVHGDWHHVLVPGILTAVLRNNGYDVTDEKIAEAMRRGAMVPPGVCGSHGICGAGAGIGTALSVIGGTTPPRSGEERSRGLLASSEVYRRIAKLGGPRCCVLSTYTAINLGARILIDMGYRIPLSRVARRCLFHKLNEECHEDCPYRPGDEGSATD
jgi:hypothetical protein